MARPGNPGRREDLTDDFEVVDNEGNVERVIEWTERIEVVDFAGRPQWADRWKRYALANGEPLNLEDDGTFTEERTGRKLRRRAP